MTFKNLLTLTLLLISTAGNCLSRPVEYSENEFVIEAFFNRYTFDKNNGKTIIKFEKQQTDWTIVLYDRFQKTDPIKQLFWGVKKKKIKKLALTTQTNKPNAQPNLGTLNPKAKSYDLGDAITGLILNNSYRIAPNVDQKEYQLKYLKCTLLTCNQEDLPDEY